MKYNRKLLFGGTFNPIHYGHLRIAEEVREALEINKVVFIPSYLPPLKNSDIAPAESRLHMVRLAIKGNPYFEVSEIEYTRQGKSFTVDTIKTYRETEPEIEPIFLVGLDSFLELPQWHKPEELVRLCDFAVVRRTMASELDELFESPYLEDTTPVEQTGAYLVFPLKGGRRLYWINCRVLEISASDIRQRLREGRSVKYLLPESVESFIIREQLYSLLKGVDNRRKPAEGETYCKGSI